MSDCLYNGTLLLLHEGNGTPAERAHLAECVACTERYQRLVDDIKKISHVLRTTPLPTAVARPRRAVAIRWVSTATAVAALLVVLGTSLWLRAPLRFLFFAEQPDPKVVRFLEDELFPALFSTTEIDLGTLPANTTDVAYLQAALDGEWPKESEEKPE